MTTPQKLKQYVRDIPGYPQPGIIFRDITPLLARKELSPRGRRHDVDGMERKAS